MLQSSALTAFFITAAAMSGPAIVKAILSLLAAVVLLGGAVSGKR